MFYSGRVSELVEQHIRSMMRYRVAGWLWFVSNAVSRLARKVERSDGAVQAHYCDKCCKWYYMAIFHPCADE